MPINPWEALMYALRTAHLCGEVKGRAVYLDPDLENESRGAVMLHITRVTEDNDYVYNISTHSSADSFQKLVYWLPWGQNETVHISSLNRYNTDFFLTSPMSGCYFVGCDGVVMHTAAGYKDNIGKYSNPVRYAFDEMTEWEVDSGPIRNTFVLSPAHRYKFATSYYGDGIPTSNNPGGPRAVVMGYKKSATQWFFAYQDMTIATSNFRSWKGLR
jgi:hypothetical protein